MTNEYALSKHRYYELKHFCLQYPEWKKLYSETDGYPDESCKILGDTTSKDGISRANLISKMSLVQNVCQSTGYEHWPTLLSYITGMSKNTYREDGELFFEYYRKFFWMLDKRKE